MTDCFEFAVLWFLAPDLPPFFVLWLLEWWLGVTLDRCESFFSLVRLGEHGLTSVAVPHGDPLAEALARDGLLSPPLDLKGSTGSTGSGGARAR